MPLVKLTRYDYNACQPTSPVWINTDSIASMERYSGKKTNWVEGASIVKEIAYTTVTMTTMWEGQNEQQFIHETPDEIMSLVTPEVSE